MGKKGDRGAQDRAASLLLKPELLPKLFGTFAQRYARREGGYTRIHKFGNRIGDNAPHAILELVDNPRDLRYEITARAIGWELLKNKLKRHTPEDIVNSGHRDTHEFLDKEKRVEVDSHKGLLRPKTRWNLQKVLRFRKPEASLDMSQKVSYYMVRWYPPSISLSAHISLRTICLPRQRSQNSLVTWLALRLQGKREVLCS